MIRRAAHDPNRYPPADTPPERCDRSPIEEARWKVTGPSGRHLTLCGHHFRKHEVALRIDGWTVEPIIKRS